MSSPIGVGVEAGGGRYLLLEVIGQGGMGEVYKASDRQLDRIVAIKTIRPDSSTDADAGKRLSREARLAASLDHPFICKIHELLPYGEGQSLLVMEYVDGHTLKDLLRDGPIDAARVLRLAREIAEALSVAHRGGMIHRDIKPSNVMVTTHGHIKVMDFGIAKAVVQPDASTTSSLTAPGHVIGTPAYMSPEQAGGRRVDARSDVFSFGVLLYECLSGTLPFVDHDSMINPADLFSTVPKALPASVPAELRALVMRCLAVKRDARYETFEAVRTALDTSMLLRVSVPSTDDRPWIGHLTRRQVTLAASGLVVIIAMLAWLIWRPNRQPAAETLEQTPFVTWPTTEEGGRISADGTKVTFVSIEHGLSRLWIRSVDGSDPHPIGAARDALKTPVWSPDGQQIGFLSRESDRAWLHIMKEWGESVGPPISLGVPWRQTTLVRWLGSHVYFAVSATDSPRSVLWRFDTGDRSVRQITHEAEGKRFWSNGELANLDIDQRETRLVFEPDSPDNRTIWVADLDGRNAQKLAVKPNLVVTPRWRGPDGTHIIYADNANGQNDIWEFDLVSQRAVALTTSPLEEAALDVSASGRVIVADTLEESAHLWAVNPDKTDAPRQLTNDSQTDLWPSASSTGRVLFHRGRGAFVGYLPRDTDLYTASWQGARLSDEKRWGPGTRASLSADGRRVAFLRWRDDGKGPDLWIADLDSTKPPVRLDDLFPASNTHSTTWEPGGQTVVWSPHDAETLYFVRSRSGGRLELMRATIGPELTATIEVLMSEAQPPPPARSLVLKDLAVAGDGAALAFVIGEQLAPNTGGRLMWLDLTQTSATPRKVLEVPRGMDLSIAGWTARQTIATLISSADQASAVQIREIGGSGPVRQPVLIPGLISVTARLDPRRDCLFVTATDKAVATVQSVPLSGRRPTTLVPNDVEGITFGGYAVTTDGWLLYMRKEVNSNVWLFRVHENNTMHDNPGR